MDKEKSCSSWFINAAVNIWHLARWDISLFCLLDVVFGKIYGKVGKLDKNTECWGAPSTLALWSYFH